MPLGAASGEITWLCRSPGMRGNRLHLVDLSDNDTLMAMARRPNGIDIRANMLMMEKYAELRRFDAKAARRR